MKDSVIDAGVTMQHDIMDTGLDLSSKVQGAGLDLYSNMQSTGIGILATLEETGRDLQNTLTKVGLSALGSIMAPKKPLRNLNSVATYGMTTTESLIFYTECVLGALIAIKVVKRIN